MAQAVVNHIPDNIIYYTNRCAEEEAKRSSRCGCWQRVTACIGRILRNAYYLPLYKKSHHVLSELSERQAQEEMRAFRGELAPYASTTSAFVGKYFFARDIQVKIRNLSDDQELQKEQVFTTRVFQLKEPIEGRFFRLIFFSFYGHAERETTNDSVRQSAWNPLTSQEISTSALYVTQAFQAFVRIDSWLPISIGNMVLDGLQYFPNARDILPSTLLINRGFTSVEKVSKHLHPYIGWALHKAAVTCNLNANSEKQLLHVLEGNIRPFQVVILETPEDYYFGGNAAFEETICADLEERNCQVCQVSLEPIDKVLIILLIFFLVKKYLQLLQEIFFYEAMRNTPVFV